MKPITFESIRNFLRTKKRGKKDGSDASFKRSDSFKRISIRRSYMDRGRKRAILRSANAAASSSAAVAGKPQPAKFNDIEVQNDALVGHFKEPGSGSGNHAAAYLPRDDDCLPNERCIDAEVEKQFCLKNKSLQEINEMCGGERVIDNRQRAVPKHSSTARDGIASTGCFVKAGSKLKKPIGTSVAVTTDTSSVPKRADSRRLSASNAHFQRNKRNVIEANEYVQQSRRSHRSKSHSSVCVDLSNGELGDASANMSKNFLNQSIDSVYVQNETRSTSTALLMSTTTSVSHSHLNVAGPTADTPSLVIFKTYCNEPNAVDTNQNSNAGSQRFLETSFDGSPAAAAAGAESEAARGGAAATAKNNVTRTSLNNDVVTVSSIDSHTFKLPPRVRTATTQDGGIVIRIPDPSTYDERPGPAPVASAETSLNGKFTFEIYKELQRTKDSSELTRPRAKDDSDPNTLGSRDASSSSSPENAAALDHCFRSMRLDERLARDNFYLESEANEFDDANVISPDSSIPYPLRIKTNPFTHQKEPYSVNLGRVWKQLNLGQDEQSLELPMLGQQLSQANLKTKNESFKSMSSHDSGFSLTLTKQKTIFDRKAPKKPKRKSKMTLNRDGYYKKIGVPTSQQSSLRRQKKKKPKRPVSPQQLFQRTLRRHIKQLQPPHPSITAINNVLGADFYETFGRYYKRRQQQADNTEADFTQELSELEAFFEEHLKRLKDYYLQKKKLNEQTISELCQEYDCGEQPADAAPSDAQRIDHVELNNDSYMNEKYFMMTNDTLKRKQQIKQKRRQLKTAASPSHALRQSPSDGASFFGDFTFPHPDKRSTASSKKKAKFHAHEVRELGQSPSDGELSSLKYASLDFRHHMANNRVSSDNVTPPYADLDYEALSYGPMQTSGQKFKKSSEDASVSRRMSRKGVIVSKSSVSSEIYLSSIFPSVLSGGSCRPPSTEPCKICCRKSLRRQFSRSGADDFDDTYENILDDERYDDADDDEDDYEHISSDEFSENEFIANSLGSELCLICDKLHSECSCSIETGSGDGNTDDAVNSSTISLLNADRNESNAIPPPKPPRHSKKLCYCDCTSGVYSSTFKSNTNQLNKRKIKRIKSKRHIGKNHSLRRDYYRHYSSKYDTRALSLRREPRETITSDNEIEFGAARQRLAPSGKIIELKKHF